jgi:ABC-type bacteriocin/lantibiotic exporter with double-glycine peptidase domain
VRLPLEVPSTRPGLAAAASLLLLVGGCGYLGSAADFDPRDLEGAPGWLVVRDVPLVLQKEATDCGIAAMHMVLGFWNVPDAGRLVLNTCPVVPEHGVRAGDLRNLARSRGLRAYLIHGEWKDLAHEVRAGHPVLVGLVKPYAAGAVTHYEVVVALHPERQVIVTHDPANGWRKNTLQGFSVEWQSAGYLTLIVFRDDPERQPSACRKEAR